MEKIAEILKRDLAANLTQQRQQLLLTPRAVEATGLEIYNTLKAAGFNDLYATSTWQQVNGSQAIKEWLISQFFEKREPKGAYIVGDNGTGKTSLMYLIARFIFKNYNYVPRFYTINNLLDMAYSKELKQQDQLRYLQNTCYLFIDDLGKEYRHEFAVSRLTQILEARYSKLLPTFVSSNIKQNDLKKIDMYRHLGDRFKDIKYMATIELTGQSKRGKNAS